MTFHNSPSVRDENNRKGRWVHQPLTIDHYGMQISIKEDGKVVIRSKPTPIDGSKDEVEYEEVTVPASLIFKATAALNMTRHFEFNEQTEKE